MGTSWFLREWEKGWPRPAMSFCPHCMALVTRPRTLWVHDDYLELSCKNCELPHFRRQNDPRVYEFPPSELLPAAEEDDDDE
jgi:hypothetical protein